MPAANAKRHAGTSGVTLDPWSAGAARTPRLVRNAATSAPKEAHRREGPRNGRFGTLFRMKTSLRTDRVTVRCDLVASVTMPVDAVPSVDVRPQAVVTQSPKTRSGFESTLVLSGHAPRMTYRKERPVPSPRLRLVFATFASFATLAACSSSAPVATVDAGLPSEGARDASPDSLALDGAQPRSDASLDAASLPPALAACTTCLQTDCAPEVQACVSDPICKGILECTATSGCLSSGAETCARGCADAAGLTPKETARVTALLLNIATSCSSCLSSCPLPEAGLDASRD